jgi:2-polyprenyl-6-methoxyphenol hydroxylase-like FAD-dependent oxidoreductase
MSEEKVDVVIAGAGPNGLMLARELALAGVHPLVLDQLPGPSGEPKANGLVGQVVRALDMRGLYHELGGAAGPPKPIPGFLFSGIPLSFDGIADNPMHALLLPQPRLVRALVEQAHQVGVNIRWGHEVTGLTQHDDGHVTLTVAGPDGSYDLTTQYLVGADGGRSRVRKWAGIEFPGTTTDVVMRLAHVSIPEELRSPGGWFEIPGFGPMPFGHTRFDNGMCVFAAFEDGRQMIGTMEFGASVPDEALVTLDEVRESLRRVLGVDVPLAPPQGVGPHALRRIDGQQTRQADRYRIGNVFLVGDAAHVHSAMGGPGLNLGLQDAVNLGWKLAAAVNGWAPAGLLDTYHSERHPVGQQVMTNSLSQTALMAPGAEVTALRELFGDLVKQRDTAARLAHTLAGSDIRYDVGDGHPLAGRLVPELRLDSGQRVAELMHAARPVLLDLAGGTFAAAVGDWRHRVDIVVGSSAAAPGAAILIRPDGYVAWATDSTDPADTDALRVAVVRWFGAAWQGATVHP